MIITSSVTTMIGNQWKSKLGENTYNENDFAPVNETSDGYFKSKIH